MLKDILLSPICWICTTLKSFLTGIKGRLFSTLVSWQWFRVKVIYPKFGIKLDASIKKTPERPILHAEVDGGKYNFPIFANQTRINDLRASRLRPDDVLVVTYPKSGTHLSGYIVKLIAEKRRNIANDDMIIPFYEMRSQATLDAIPTDVQRIMKTHLPIELIPKCEDSSVQNKIIFCLRDPKDACASYYKFVKQLEMLTGPVNLTLEEFVDLWLEGCTDYGDWFELVKPYWEQRFRSNVLFISYEGILKDPVQTIQTIASFLGHGVLLDAEVEEIRSKIQFNNMKQELAKKNAMATKTVMNKGISGAGAKSFTDRQNKIFNERFKREMEGLDFDYYDYS